MTEKYTIKRVGKHEKFGEWMLVDDGSEKGSFKGISPQVAGFLSKQVPCEIEVEETKDVENRKGVITRVRVLGKSYEQKPENQFEQPVEVVKMGNKQEFTTANEYGNGYDNRQKSIVNQFCIREGIRMIEVGNLSREEKILPTKANILVYSQIIKEVYEELMNPNPNDNEYPEY